MIRLLAVLKKNLKKKEHFKLFHLISTTCKSFESDFKISNSNLSLCVCVYTTEARVCTTDIFEALAMIFLRELELTCGGASQTDFEITTAREERIISDQKNC